MLDVKEYGNIKEIYKWEVVGVKLLIEIKEVCKQDYKKAQKFACLLYTSDAADEL